MKFHDILVGSFNKLMLSFYSYDAKVSVGVTSGQLAMWLENNEGMRKHRIYYDNIGMISKLCEADKYETMSPKDITVIILYCLKRNLSAGILEKDIKISSSDSLSDNFNIKSLSPKVLLSSMNAGSYYESYRLINEALYLGAEAKEDTLYVLLNSKIDNLDFKKEQYALIKEYYFDKLNSYTHDDVSIIIEVMKNLGVSETVLLDVENTLISKIVKRQSKKDKTYVLPVKSVQETQELVGKKERYAIEKELANYFDFMKMEPLVDKALTAKEIVYCVGLLEKIGASENSINDFMYKSFKNARKARKSLDAMFDELQVKLQFYGIDNEDVRKSLETITMFMPEYLSLRNKTDNTAELKEWEEIIATELDNIKSYIPVGYEYEKAQILSLRMKIQEENC